MESRWKNAESREYIARYANDGINEDVALRVYTTRLLGSDPRLVLHGGGNTSVKTTVTDQLGDEASVLCVKGSGWDMGHIEPAGLPAVRMDVLRRLQSLDALSDEDMVSIQRTALISPASPNPSVETLLHAFLPHKFIDHTHSTAVLALTDQPDGEAICAAVYGDRAALVPYVMPGFGLAKLAAEVQAANPDVEGLILLKHGIFSFGETAEEAYSRMIALVGLAEAHIDAAGKKAFKAAALPKKTLSVEEVAPIVRGAVSECLDDNDGLWRRQVLAFRTSEPIRNFVDGADVARYAQQGVVTPDHTIRTKNWPLILPAPAKLDVFQMATTEAVSTFVATYHDYFARHNGQREPEKNALDPMPRVVLVPGVGIFGLGKSAKDAAIAADITENMIDVVTDAESIGSFQPVPEADLFDVEYWSLEQAKLGKGAEKPLARQVAVVTGGAGGIGAATARALAAQGAEVVVFDRDDVGARQTAGEIGGAALGFGCDVTDPAQVANAFAQVCIAFGGVDIVVSNAGAAWQGRIGEVDDADLRASFELNFFAHQSIAKEATRIMVAQGTGGCLLFNTSKQAVNPGPDFGPYGLPKAATLFLMRQYALDYGDAGIRTGAVNADRVNTGIFADGLLEQRAKARNLTPEQYLRSGNLLNREVKAEDVAQAFIDLALARKSTGAVMTVDGGNIAAALR
jgi:rhamnose utilization protein RhaD (predicted bifunctional aldolase and dehydrogenase)/NAD(P)-dependent dehydrogenase (short-subunit alcohol dehydrogenase family)